MKKKNSIQTCGSLKGPEYAHLGHFRQAKHIEAGHNTNAMPGEPKKKLLGVIDGTLERTFDTREPKKAPPAGGVRG